MIDRVGPGEGGINDLSGGLLEATFMDAFEAVSAVAGQNRPISTVPDPRTDPVTPLKRDGLRCSGTTPWCSQGKSPLQSAAPNGRPGGSPKPSYLRSSGKTARFGFRYAFRLITRSPQAADSRSGKIVPLLEFPKKGWACFVWSPLHGGRCFPAIKVQPDEPEGRGFAAVLNTTFP